MFTYKDAQETRLGSQSDSAAISEPRGFGWGGNSELMPCCQSRHASSADACGSVHHSGGKEERDHGPSFDYANAMSVALHVNDGCTHSSAKSTARVLSEYLTLRLSNSSLALSSEFKTMVGVRKSLK